MGFYHKFKATKKLKYFSRQLLQFHLTGDTEPVSYSRLLGWETPPACRDHYVRTTDDCIVPLSIFRKFFVVTSDDTTLSPIIPVSEFKKDAQYKFAIDLFNDKPNRNENQKALSYLMLKAQRLTYNFGMDRHHPSFTFHYYDNDAETSIIHLHIYGVNTTPEYSYNVASCLYETYRHGKTKALQETISVMNNNLSVPLLFVSKNKVRSHKDTR